MCQCAARCKIKENMFFKTPPLARAFSKAQCAGVPEAIKLVLEKIKLHSLNQNAMTNRSYEGQTVNLQSKHKATACGGVI